MNGYEHIKKWIAQLEGECGAAKHTDPREVWMLLQAIGNVCTTSAATDSEPTTTNKEGQDNE